MINTKINQLTHNELATVSLFEFSNFVPRNEMFSFRIKDRPHEGRVLPVVRTWAHKNLECPWTSKSSKL